VLPVVFALAAALAASATAITLHNRSRQRGTTADGLALAEQARATQSTAAALPVLNRGPLLRNVAIAGLVGLVAGIVAAGSGAAAFTIAALAGATAVAAVALRPEWALVGLIALVTLRLAENARDFYGIPQLTIPAIAVVVLVLVFRRFVWGERPTGLATALGAISLVAIASLVSVINASFPDASLGPMVELAKSAVVLVLVIVLINSARDYRLAIWTLIVLGGLIAGLSVFQYLTGSFGRPFFGLAQARIMNIAFDVNDYRISGPFGDPNFFGQALVPIFAIALERAWHESRPRLRLVAAVAVVVVPLAIIFTFSRGALVALVVVGVAMLFSLRPSWRAIAAGAAALAVVIILLPPGYVERTTALFETNEAAVVSSDPSVDQRTSILIAGLQMFYDYPVAGIGIGNFPDRYLEYAGEIGLDHTRAAIQPHSFFLEIAAETGLIGLIAWGVVGAFIIEIFRRARRRLAEAGERELYQMITAYAIGLLGFYTAGLFLHLAFARYMWVLLGVVFAVPKVVESVIASRRTAVGAS
jgi:O-antigen ligase